MNALDIFYEICDIPHPTGNTKDLGDFICNFASKYNCNVKCDNFGNIYIVKGVPKVCLQAHYDMVLIGEHIEPYIDNGWLKSRNSSLGADNGAGLAIILFLLTQSNNFEALITDDEEIGLIGAKNVNFNIVSRKIINLDGEYINDIVVGCAGGLDVEIPLKPNFDDCNFKYFYEIQTDSRNFVGGHSGFDIHRNIKNAIVELVYFIYKIPCDVVEITGGEKLNSIPVSARAIVATNELLDTSKSEWISVKKLDKTYLKSAKKDFLYPVIALHSGVYAVDNNVISSLNISTISNTNLILMVRSNRKHLLSRHEDRLRIMFGDIKISGVCTPWEYQDSALLTEIKSVFKKHGIDYSIVEVHGIFESGILKSICDEIVSIGPTILNPHSKLESLNLDSFDRLTVLLKDLI